MLSHRTSRSDGEYCLWPATSLALTTPCSSSRQGGSFDMDLDVTKGSVQYIDLPSPADLAILDYQAQCVHLARCLDGKASPYKYRPNPGPEVYPSTLRRRQPLGNGNGRLRDRETPRPCEQVCYFSSILIGFLSESWSVCARSAALRNLELAGGEVVAAI